MCPCTLTRDHPRVCGEDVLDSIIDGSYQGPPPRMRGRQTSVFLNTVPLRTTPAYAGKTTERVHRHIEHRDHPRVCGEDPRR